VERSDFDKAMAERSFFDKAISALSPAWAAKRMAANMAIDELIRTRANFAGADINRLTNDWNVTSGDADSTNSDSLELLRNRVRDKQRNSGMVAGPVRRMKNNVVGGGIMPQARAREIPGVLSKEQAEAFNKRIDELWAEHVPKGDAHLKQSIYEQQGLMFTSYIQDGEVLTVYRSSNNWERYGRNMPLVKEVIEIDRLRTPSKEISNPRIRNGIEYDNEGVPIKYYVLKQHPGAMFMPLPTDNDIEEIDAFAGGLQKVSHLFNMLRPGQSRGYSFFAAALRDINDLDQIQESARVKQRIEAMLALIIETPARDGMYNAQSSNAAGEKIKKFGPGGVLTTQPGETVKVVDPSRTAGEVEQLLMFCQRGAANAVGVSYEFFANDWRRLSYSNARTIKLEDYAAFDDHQRYMIIHDSIPYRESFVTEAVAMGLVRAPRFMEFKVNYLRTDYTPAVNRRWVDPKKESEAAVSDINNNITTLAAVAASKGMDYKDNLKQRAKELREIKALEEEFDVNMSGPEAAIASAVANNGGDGNA
jgi:lambda family phage portal protein